MKLPGEIIKTDTLRYPGCYWFVVRVKLASDNYYEMDVVRLTKHGYSLYRGNKQLKIIVAKPDQITIINDNEAKIMKKIYNMSKTVKI